MMEYDVNVPVVTATGAGQTLSFAGTQYGAISIVKLTAGVDVWCKINGVPVASDIPGQFRLTDAVPSISIPRCIVTSVGVITAGGSCVVQAVATIGEQS